MGVGVGIGGRLWGERAGRCFEEYIRINFVRKIKSRMRVTVVTILVVTMETIIHCSKYLNESLIFFHRQ